MTHSEEATAGDSESKLEWKDYLQGVPAKIYFNNCRTIPEFRYVDFLDYMAIEEKENCTLKRCQSVWFESIHKLSRTQHAGLKGLVFLNGLKSCAKNLSDDKLTYVIGYPIANPN
ncbi:hypothetical protein EC991_010031 [Linnemannia zychae]|nr:hypothetical protein EC991_010031 [Linnemannia zychae]